MKYVLQQCLFVVIIGWTHLLPVPLCKAKMCLALATTNISECSLDIWNVLLGQTVPKALTPMFIEFWRAMRCMMSLSNDKRRTVYNNLN